MTRKQFLLAATALAGLLIATTAAAQDYPAPIQALQDRGVHIVGTFEAPGGMTGYAGISNHQPIALYVTADGAYVIVGSMLDSEGNFVDQDTLHEMTAGPMSRRIWTQLENSSWVAEGDADAPRTVYVFSDPNCPYCYLFWKQVQPWVDSGKVELRHVIVGIIGKTSDNKAASILTADDPEQLLVQNKENFQTGGITPMDEVPAEIKDKLTANLQLMRQMGMRGTPGIIYRDAEGTVQFWRGLPPADVMTRIFGSR